MGQEGLVMPSSPALSLLCFGSWDGLLGKAEVLVPVGAKQ